VIHQFAELGQYYREREGIGTTSEDQLRLYARDPAQKFRTNTILLLVFSNEGFRRVQVEQYDDTKRLMYLYRPGPPNGWDATPTSGFKPTSSLRDKPKTQEDFDKALTEELRKKIVRLKSSVEDSTNSNSDAPEDEKSNLSIVKAILSCAAEDTETGLGDRKKIACQVRTLFPPKEKKNTVVSDDAIISIAWETSRGNLKRVGDFVTFQQSLIRQGSHSASTKKGITGEVKGIGQCSICGKLDTAVSGLLQIPNFKIYTLDKAGSVSGGFDPSRAWQNFPACRECCDRVDFAGERVKKKLAFGYYGFKYLVLPSPIQPLLTLAYDFLDRLTDARLSRSAIKRLTDAEDEILYVLAQEKSVLQVDLLFYEPDPQSFRPALYVPGLLPTRFRKLFEAKDRVDDHPWFKEPSPKSFTKEHFTFGSLRNILNTFDDDFLAATRAALELRQFSRERLLQIGMRWVQQDYRNSKAWQFRLANLFRSILFFEILTNANLERGEMLMGVDYGDSEQADRVRKVFDETSGKLRIDSAAQAAFLVGACCSRIETIQERIRGSVPFAGKLKGFRLNQADVQKLFVAAKDKAKAYGPEEERKVSGLLGCAAAALAATPEHWSLSSDEVSYFFTLGHALRSRFAKDTGDAYAKNNS
jgi:CRISPR-associated protein Csh1